MVEALKPFQSPQELLGDVDPTTVGSVITVASDVALVVDGDGVVRDVAVGSDQVRLDGYGRWVGRRWAEIVTTDSRPKVEALRREAKQGTASSWRHLNHRSPTGGDLPINYAAVEIRPDGRLVAVGRDLSDVASLQQRLVEAQQALEQDYARVRQAEMRYRLLFQATSEPVLIVEAAALKVTEANAAAEALVGNRLPLIGAALSHLFDPSGARSIDTLFATLNSTGHADDIQLQLAFDPSTVRVSALLFRQDNTSFFLVRLAPSPADEAAARAPGANPKLCAYVESSADGFAVTDTLGRLITANRAFLDLAQVPVEAQAVGRSLERWLGRGGIDLRILLTNLREKGTIRLFATSLQGEQGSTSSVEVSAAAVSGADPTCFCFSIRNVNQRLVRGLGSDQDIPRSAEQLSQLIGVLPLKEIVRQSTDIIERLSIEAALRLTNDNRVSAAELLGLSRQSLYVKLRRFGLIDVPC